MEVDKLEKMKYSVMKYKELQKLAKKVGVKANLPKADLIKALLEKMWDCKIENISKYLN